MAVYGDRTVGGVGLPPNYCMSGINLGFVPGTGFSNGSQIQGDLHTAMVAFENHIGHPMECVNYAGPNSLGSFDNYFKAMVGMPQHIVFNIQLCPTGGTLAKVLTGTYDSLFNAIWASIIRWGFGTSQLTLRLGWESTLKGFPWSVGLNGQTSQNYIDAYRYVVALARSHGITVASGVTWEYNGGGVMYPDISLAYPGDDVVDVVGHDRYAEIWATWTYSKSQLPQAWANETLPMLNGIVSFIASRDAPRAAAGLAPLRMGMSECGEIIQAGNPNRANDSAFYWQAMYDFINANPTRMAYVCYFHQNTFNKDSTGTIIGTNEDTQMYFSVSSGTLADQSPSTAHDTSTHGPYVDQTSNTHALAKPVWENLFTPPIIASYTPPVIVPPTTGGGADSSAQSTGQVRRAIQMMVG